MATVIVERALPPSTTREALETMAKEASWCFETYGVTHLHSWLAKDGTRLLCLYEAPDAESVRQTQISGNLPFERVYTAEKITFGD